MNRLRQAIQLRELLEHPAFTPHEQQQTKQWLDSCPETYLVEAALKKAKKLRADYRNQNKDLTWLKNYAESRGMTLEELQTHPRKRDQLTLGLEQQAEGGENSSD